jgi:hypothetical protein
MSIEAIFLFSTAAITSAIMTDWVCTVGLEAIIFLF